MEIAVIGGTGTLGRLVVDELAKRGDAVRILTRTPPASMGDRVAHHRIDLTTGEGLDDALAGVDAVVDSSSAQRGVKKVLVDGTGRVLAAEKRAGVAHHVLISIIGIDDVPLSYYKAKLQQEKAVKDSGVAWTIVRASQFHSLVGGALDGAAKLRLSLRSRSRVQPVDPQVVAERLADAVHAGPGGYLPEIGGPEARTLSDWAHLYAERSGRKLLPLPLPLPPKLGRPLRAGALTNPAAAAGGETFEQWLATRS
jgi:uncharacterized protein YbjT (DUF2867 family)